MRRLIEGRRVDAEIKNMIREAETRTDTNDGGAALGRTVPRASDNELLDDYAERLDEQDGRLPAAGGSR
ncbi:hypothetical protein HrrHc1_115 [Halorubrum phage Hardycor1]|nr:hypothetical protein HrrHc1_115 [Halorubrum phage Hardycor1]